jgi:hypothetical protein
LIKGWSITVAAAIYGYAAAHFSWRAAAVGLLPAIVFWGLDAYYLWNERLFRGLYDEAARGSLATYSMDTTSYRHRTKWATALASRTILPLYLLMVLVGVALVIGGAVHHK